MQMFKNLDHLIYINKHVYLLNFYISFIFFFCQGQIILLPCSTEKEETWWVFSQSSNLIMSSIHTF